MVRRLISLATGLLVCLGLFGCSGDRSDQADPSAPLTATSTPKAPDAKDARTAQAANRSQTAAVAQRLRRVDRKVPANADVIFAPFTGHGDRRLSIDPRYKNFSLGFMCEGPGRFDVVTGTDTVRPKPCRRGVGLWLTVATNGSPAVLRVHATPDITWRMAVIEGDNLGPDVKPVH